MIIGFLFLFLLTFKGTLGESTEEEVSVKASGRAVLNVCALPMDPGPCKALHPMFYYHAKEGKCLPFNYGGCKGSLNRFESIEECNQVCVERGPKSCDGGSYHCPDGDRRWCHVGGFAPPLYYYDKATSECKPENYCCGLSEEYTFRTKESCEKHCKTEANPTKPDYDFCKVDLDSFECEDLLGPDDNIRCNHNMKLYVHSKEAGKCIQLNACCNRKIVDKLFYDKRDCERFCHADDPPPWKCIGEDLDNCSDWHPSCNHGKNMVVFDKEDQACKLLKKCCPYGRYLFKNPYSCYRRCHPILI